MSMTVSLERLNSITIELQMQLQDIFSQRGFLLRKWNSSDPCVLHHLSADLKDCQPMQMSASDEYTNIQGSNGMQPWITSTRRWQIHLHLVTSPSELSSPTSPTPLMCLDDFPLPLSKWRSWPSYYGRREMTLYHHLSMMLGSNRVQNSISSQTNSLLPW